MEPENQARSWPDPVTSPHGHTSAIAMKTTKKKKKSLPYINKIFIGSLRQHPFAPCPLSPTPPSCPRYESAFWSDRKVLHLELDLGDSGMAALMGPGDAIGVCPANSPDLVARLLARLGGLPADKVGAELSHKP